MSCIYCELHDWWIQVDHLIMSPCDDHSSVACYDYSSTRRLAASVLCVKPLPRTPHQCHGVVISFMWRVITRPTVNVWVCQWLTHHWLLWIPVFTVRWVLAVEWRLSFHACLSSRRKHWLCVINGHQRFSIFFASYSPNLSHYAGSSRTICVFVLWVGTESNTFDRWQHSDVLQTAATGS